jgi:hypothetical protein
MSLCKKTCVVPFQVLQSSNRGLQLLLMQFRTKPLLAHTVILIVITNQDSTSSRLLQCTHTYVSIRLDAPFALVFVHSGNALCAVCLISRSPVKIGRQHFANKNGPDCQLNCILASLLVWTNRQVAVLTVILVYTGRTSENSTHDHRFDSCN